MFKVLRLFLLYILRSENVGKSIKYFFYFEFYKEKHKIFHFLSFISLSLSHCLFLKCFFSSGTDQEISHIMLVS